MSLTTLSDSMVLGTSGSIVLRLVLAAVLGGVLGWERERSHRPAGLRTYTLVTLGAALFTIASMYGFNGVVPGATADPSRVAAQIVTGIGFLGAGTVLRTEQIVQGLTTAAGVWLAAAVGLTVAAGLYATAIFVTVLALVVFTVLRRFEQHNDTVE